MEVDIEKQVLHSIYDGIRDGVKTKLTGYNSPLDKLIASALEVNHTTFRALLEQSIESCVDNVEFRDEIKQAVRSSLAKTLIQRFGGEIEKQVNVLKSDPTTRARITLAIEEIVKTQPN